MASCRPCAHQPFVLVDRRTDAGHTSVTCVDRFGGRLVAEHLLSLGRTSVGVIAGEPFASTRPSVA